MRYDMDSTLERAYERCSADRFTGRGPFDRFNPNAAGAAREDTDADDGWPTARRFSRTLTGTEAAFPHDPEYAHVSEAPQHRGAPWVWWLYLAVAVAGFAASALFPLPWFGQ